MLRVVRAPNGSEGGDTPKKRRCIRRPAHSLTDVEAMRLRAALRNLRALYGSWECLAEVMTVNKSSLQNIVHGRQTPGADMARRTAKAADTTLDALLGKPGAVGRCPSCGVVRGAS